MGAPPPPLATARRPAGAARHDHRARPAGAAARRRLKYALYAVLWLAVRTLLALLLGLRVRGARHLPRRGPVIVVANHLHNFDPVVLSASLPRPVYYMAKRELFEHPLLAPV